KVLQRTPVRVLHRRSPLDREKIIHWMKIEEIAGNSQYFLLHLCTQYGISASTLFDLEEMMSTRLFYTST
nr:putative tRNA pseudouridine synthase Pus10 [Tanacetum cinerariifolium]